MSMCKELSTTGTNDTAVYIEIDDDGVLHVASEPTFRTGVLKEIITEQPVESTPAAAASPAVSAVSATPKVGEASTSVDTRQPLGTRSASRLNAGPSAPAQGSNQPADDSDGYVINTGTGSVIVSKAELNRRMRSLDLWQSHLLVLRQFEDRKHVALKACQWNKASLKRNTSQKDLADAFLKAGIPQAIKALQEATPVGVAAAAAAAVAEVAAQHAAAVAAVESTTSDGEPAAKRFKTGPGI